MVRKIEDMRKNIIDSRTFTLLIYYSLFYKPKDLSLFPREPQVEEIFSQWAIVLVVFAIIAHKINLYTNAKAKVVYGFLFYRFIS